MICNCEICKWKRREISREAYIKYLKSFQNCIVQCKDSESNRFEVEEHIIEAEKSKKIYISGPITANKEHYRECFSAAVDFLKSKGYDVIDPSIDDYTEAVKSAGIEDVWSKEAWVYYLQRDINIVANCDGIYLLKGWEESNGATVELAVAKHCNIPVYFEERQDEVPNVEEN